MHWLPTPMQSTGQQYCQYASRAVADKCAIHSATLLAYQSYCMSGARCLCLGLLWRLPCMPCNMHPSRTYLECRQLVRSWDALGQTKASHQPCLTAWSEPLTAHTFIFWLMCGILLQSSIDAVFEVWRVCAKDVFSNELKFQ